MPNAALDRSLIGDERRAELLARHVSLPSGRARADRFWKIDLDAVDLSSETAAESVPPCISAPHRPGLIAVDLTTAARDHAELFHRFFGSVADAGADKFMAAALARCNAGAFVYVPRGICVDDPIVITYRAAGALFPYTLVVLEAGARADVVEELIDAPLVCGMVEVVAAENACAEYSVIQDLPEQARVFVTRTAAPGRGGHVVFNAAELGAALSVGTLEARIDQPGADVRIHALFFPRGEQHVDLRSGAVHAVGESQSATVVKSAATGRGQGRYVGNIAIAHDAQGTQAALRDDALLLSKHAHIESVPALEIAANDVKAYHGATVGAIDEDELFYMTSRGIPREQAEEMIALGFFEPVIEHFPTEALRERVRARLERQLQG